MTKKKTPYPKGTYPRSAEHRAKISENSKRTWAEKGGGPMKDKKHSEESRAAMSAGMKAAWADGTRKRHPPKNGTYTCPGCGTVKAYESKREVGKRQFCTLACRLETRAGLGGAHGNWKGGVIITTHGYRQLNVAGSYVMEHRFVMEQHLGRPLMDKETVHHRNGDKLDNRLENLELWASRHPKGQRVEDLVEFAREILALYAPD